MTRVFLVAFLLCLGSLAQGQPAIRGVVNGASFALANQQNGAIAQGSIFVAFTRNAGPNVLTQATTLPLPRTLAGTSIRVVSAGTSVDAIILYTREDQIAAILPSNTPVGNASMTVTYNGVASSSFAVRVVRSSFGAFAVNQQGSGPGVFFNFLAAGNEPLNTLRQTAVPGQVVTLYGTGGGPVTSDETRPAAVALATPVQVYVGNREAQVQYFGRSSCCSGLDQINFVVPQGVEGCYVPVHVVTDGVVSNFTTLAISTTAGAACTNLNGPDGSDIPATGNARIGSIALSRFSITLSPFLPTARLETGNAAFTRGPSQNAALNFNYNQIAVGSCYAFSFVGTDIINILDTPARPGLEYLNAGTLRVANTQRGNRDFEYNNGVYAVTLASVGLPITGGSQTPYLEPGTYTISASGADVGAFSQNVTVGGPVTWSNPITSLDRSRDLAVNWTGGDPGTVVTWIAGTSTTVNNTTQGSVVVCSDLAERRTLTVPSRVLRTLVPTSQTTDQGYVVLSNYARETRVTPTPANMDAVFILSSSATGGLLNVLP